MPNAPVKKKKGRTPLPPFTWDGDQLHRCLCNIYLGGEMGHGTKGMIASRIRMPQQAYSRLTCSPAAPLQTLARLVAQHPGLTMIIEGTHVHFKNHEVPGRDVTGAQGPALPRPPFLS